MSSTAFTLFETPIGLCGLAWGARGVTAAQLPEQSAEATRRRLARLGETEAAPTPEIAAIIARIVALMSGARDDMIDVALDMAGLPEFSQRVYAAARAIPPGETRTYGQIARAMGDVGFARAVGGALGRNPFPIIVPCHRVLAVGGAMGGFSAHGGTTTKQRLLALEGVPQSGAPSLFDDLPLKRKN